MQEFDVAIIGMGPGGEHVAGTLAERGLRVVGVDRGLVGGECPYWGCVPSKMMIRAADSLAEARRVPDLGGSVASVSPDWAPVARRIRQEATDNWDDTVAVERFESKGGVLIRGVGAVAGVGKVRVGEEDIALSRGIVVATGTEPAVPPIDGLASVDYWTNRDAIEVEDLPESLIVLGGGSIGCELAQVFARFGVAVTIVEAADQLLPRDEPEAAEIVRAALAAEGLDIRIGHAARSVSQGDRSFAVTLDDGGVVTAERLLVATGRRADPVAVGLDSVGVDASARTAPVDDRCRVTDGVWAVGDVTGKGAFTHVAMYQADIVIRDILGEGGPPADYRALPRVTFTDPEVGSVGLTEEQARKSLSNVRVGMTQVPRTARGWIHKVGNDGIIKVIEDSDRGVLVGATSMGPSGGEVLGALSVAVHGEVPVASLRSMIYAYPTFHRGIEDAIRELA